MSIHAEVHVTNQAYRVQELVGIAIDSWSEGAGLPVNNSGFGFYLQDTEIDMVTQVNEFLAALKERVDEMVGSAEEVSMFINGQSNTSIYDIANV
jgi:hypothetical protein